MYQSFDLSGDPREGWFSFNDLSGDALISQLKSLTRVVQQLSLDAQIKTLSGSL